MRQFLPRQFQTRQFQLRQFALKKSGAGGGGGSGVVELEQMGSLRRTIVRVHRPQDEDEEALLLALLAGEV